MKVSIVIPNYNGEDLLKKNLPRIIASAEKFTKKGEVEIIIVDDGSSDNSISVINNQVEKNLSNPVAIHLIKQAVNKGFSSTVNLGAKHASGDILILLNTDVHAENNEDFFSKALPLFEDSELFAVGFMDKSIEEDGKVVLRGRGIGEWKRGFLTHDKGEVNKKNTLWVSGGSSAFKKTLWDKLSGMNEMYNPFYWEDIDLSYRAQKRGYKVLFEPSCVVVHEHEKGAIKTSTSTFQIQATSYRNQFQFVWLNLTDTSLFVEHILWLPFHFINTLLKGDIAFSIGFFRALFRLPLILDVRGKEKKKNIVSDREIISVFVEEKE